MFQHSFQSPLFSNHFVHRVLGENRHRQPPDQLDRPQRPPAHHRNLVQHMRSGSHIRPAVPRQRLPTVHCGQHIHRPASAPPETQSGLCGRRLRVLPGKTVHFFRRNRLERLDPASSRLRCVLLSWFVRFGSNDYDERVALHVGVKGKLLITIKKWKLFSRAIVILSG